MTVFRKEMEADSLAHTTSTSTTLRSVGLGDECFYEATDLALLVKPVGENEGQSLAGRKKAGLAHLISRCLPVSITAVMSGMVTPVSARLLGSEE